MAPKYELYTYFRSSCSARVRIAACYKGIPLDYTFVSLLKDEHKDPKYAELNPSELLPTLIVIQEDGTKIKITQSIAILEFFEESRPELQSLLPSSSDPISRAKVRELVNIVACDIQPVTNMKLLRKAKTFGIEAAEWAKEYMAPGMKAYEQLCSSSAGRFSVGDSVTLADVTLAPAVDNCLRFGVDMKQFPTIMKIYQETQNLEAFQAGGWKSQPDTPEDLRSKA